MGYVVSAIISDTFNWLIEKQNKRKQRSICLLQYPSLSDLVALPYKSRDFIYNHVGCVVSAIMSDTFNWLIEKQNKRKQRSMCLLQYPT